MLLLCALGAGGAAVAHGDHDLARQALESGQVLPLATVLGKLAHEAPGQVLKVEFEREDGRFIYEIRLLQNDGRVAKLKVDAVDGRVLAIKRKDTEKDRDANSRGGR
ncbi:MAG: PepSY domain-containing protein [Burkholderiaceae bacterium]